MCLYFDLNEISSEPVLGVRLNGLVLHSDHDGGGGDDVGEARRRIVTSVVLHFYHRIHHRSRRRRRNVDDAEPALGVAVGIEDSEEGSTGVAVGDAPEEELVDYTAEAVEGSLVCFLRG